MSFFSAPLIHVKQNRKFTILRKKEALEYHEQKEALEYQDERKPWNTTNKRKPWNTRMKGSPGIPQTTGSPGFRVGHSFLLKERSVL